MSDDESSGGGCGCLGVIITVIVIWALLFGVTVGGEHYILNCSGDQGVSIDGFDDVPRSPQTEEEHQDAE